MLPPEAMFSSGMDLFFGLVAGAIVLAVVLAAVMRVRECDSESAGFAALLRVLVTKC